MPPHYPKTNAKKLSNFTGAVQRPDSCPVLLVEKTDRLYRNLKDWVTIDELGLDVHFVKENVVLSPESRSTEKFMHGIKVLMAKNYIDNLSEEVKKGMVEKAEQGIWPTMAPLGYRKIDGPNGKRVIEPNPSTAPLVARLFDLYATGSYSLTELVRLARAEGLRTRSNRPVVRSHFHRLLRNRIYTGEFEWQGEVYEGIHQPLISKDLWERVQLVLDGRAHKPLHGGEHRFAFSGLISCGHCGCSLVGEIKKGRYIYHHCTGYKGKCPEPYVREEVLEGAFTNLLNRLAFDNEVLAWVKDALHQSGADERRQHAEAVKRLQGEYDRLQRRLDAMYVDKLDGKVDGAFFARMSGEWRAEQERVLRSIGQLQNAEQSYLVHTCLVEHNNVYWGVWHDMRQRSR